MPPTSDSSQKPYFDTLPVRDSWVNVERLGVQPRILTGDHSVILSNGWQPQQGKVGTNPLAVQASPHDNLSWSSHLRDTEGSDYRYVFLKTRHASLADTAFRARSPEELEVNSLRPLRRRALRW